MHLLPESQYHLALKPIKKVSINHLFAQSVIELKTEGKVYADDINNPKTFLVSIPYGMSMLFGDSKNEEFNQWFCDYVLNKNKERQHFEWLQVATTNWKKQMEKLLGEKTVTSKENKENQDSSIIELNTRINFNFNIEKYIEVSGFRSNPATQIVATDAKIFNEMDGSVVPKNFFTHIEHFAEQGVGFSLLYNDKLAATAFSSFIVDNKLEIGIETLPEFRGNGFAQMVCAAIINYCLQNNYEPVWSCRLENAPSYKLAQKLGFDVKSRHPYYRLTL